MKTITATILLLRSRDILKKAVPSSVKTSTMNLLSSRSMREVEMKMVQKKRRKLQLHNMSHPGAAIVVEVDKAALEQAMPKQEELSEAVEAQVELRSPPSLIIVI